MSSQTEVVQRLEERVVRVQADLTRDLAAVKESQTRLERRINDIPNQQRTTTLPGMILMMTCLYFLTPQQPTIAPPVFLAFLKLMIFFKLFDNCAFFD